MASREPEFLGSVYLAFRADREFPAIPEFQGFLVTQEFPARRVNLVFQVYLVFQGDLAFRGYQAFPVHQEFLARRASLVLQAFPAFQATPQATQASEQPHN